jgi:glutamate-5-semialdehyde dehydrogenase
MTTLDLARRAKSTVTKLQTLSEEARRSVLKNLALNLKNSSAKIIQENEKDLKIARELKLKESLIDRLTLTSKRIENLSSSVEEIANFPQVVGQVIDQKKRTDGLIIERQRIPLGVITMIFESRPNVVIDAAALAIKSGNAILLKGGKEALHTNQCLFNLIQESLTGLIPSESIVLLTERSQIDELLTLDRYIDLIIPRGGEALVRNVKEKATMMVMSHDRGVCHVYIHSDADPKMAMDIVMNSKVARPGVCNAMETLLVHQDFPKTEFDKIMKSIADAGVSIHQDYATEWLDKKMNLKMVSSLDEAIKHIQTYGTHHTEVIVANDEKAISHFFESLDAACLLSNASTRFNDGGELGMGAELGISTSKFHAYGPVGAEAMTTVRTIVKGHGQIRK